MEVPDEREEATVSLCSTDTDLTTVMNWVLGDAVLSCELSWEEWAFLEDSRD